MRVENTLKFVRLHKHQPEYITVASAMTKKCVVLTALGDTVVKTSLVTL